MVVIGDLKCCGICLVRSQCVEPCYKYYKMMWPLKGTLKAFLYMYEKTPTGKIGDIIVEPFLVFIVASIFIAYHFMVIGICPSYGNEIKNQMDKRLTLWAEEILDDEE